MNSPIHQDTRTAAFAEQQMRTWTRLQETAASAAAHPAAGPATAAGIGYVAVSREAGAAGAIVARLVGEHLGWEVYDRNLLDHVAQRYKESRFESYAPADLGDQRKSDLAKLKGAKASEAAQKKAGYDTSVDLVF